MCAVINHSAQADEYQLSTNVQ